MQDSADEATRKETTDRYKQFRGSYEESMASWLERLQEGEIKRHLENKVKASADAIFAVVDSELLPPSRRKTLTPKTPFLKSLKSCSLNTRSQ